MDWKHHRKPILKTPETSLPVSQRLFSGDGGSELVVIVSYCFTLARFGSNFCLTVFPR